MPASRVGSGLSTTADASRRPPQDRGIEPTVPPIAPRPAGRPAARPPDDVKSPDPRRSEITQSQAPRLGAWRFDTLFDG